MLALACREGLAMQQADVKTAYLYGDLEEAI